MIIKKFSYGVKDNGSADICNTSCFDALSKDVLALKQLEDI